MLDAVDKDTNKNGILNQVSLPSSIQYPESGLCQCFLHYGFFSFAYLLAPHGIVESLLFEQGVVRTCFDNMSFFQHVDAVGMHDGREAVRDHDRNMLPLRGNAADR